MQWKLTEKYNYLKQQKKNIMPSFLSIYHKFFRSIDLFPTSKFLRYNGETEYTTTTGGMCSAAIIIILIILFFSMGVKTIRKQIINSSITTQNQIDPSQLTFTTSPDGDIMFVLYMMGFDLISGPKLFDFYLTQENYSFGTFIGQRSIPLVQCTLAHLNFTHEIASSFDKLNFSRCLCPPLGYQFTVQGKISGQTFTQLTLSAQRCNNSIDANCVNDSTFSVYEAAVGNFNFALALVNTNINPTDNIYRQAYLDDRIFFSFSSQLGVSLTCEIQCDIIETDESLTPFTQIRSQTVIHMPDKPSTSNYMKTSSSPYMNVQLRKSAKTVTYSRSFNKLDTYMSYIGGLVGTLIGIIFIMGPYTEKSYQISLAKKLLLDNNHQGIRSELFSMKQYILIGIKKMLAFFGCDPNWPTIQGFIEGSQELAMQIDVTYIVRKLMFLDAAISKLMEKHEIQALCMRQKPTIENAKQQRRIHFAPELLDKYNRNNQKLEKQLGQGESDQNNNFINCVMEQSPSHLVQHSAKKCNFEDASALEFSQNQEDVQNITKSVFRVMQQGQAGKSTSINILKDLLPSYLQTFKKEKDDKKISMIDVESIRAGRSSFEERQYDLMKVANSYKNEGHEGA